MNSNPEDDPDIDLAAAQILSKLRSDQADKQLRLNRKQRQNKIVDLDADCDD